MRQEQESAAPRHRALSASPILERLRALPRRELLLLALAIAVGLVVRVVYVLSTRHLGLAGDSPEYDAEGRLIAAGHFFYTRLPFGHLHASAWKAPGYPFWVGAWYWVFGPSAFTLRLVQCLIGPITIVLTWALGRRLFDWRIAIAGAFLVAVYPLAFQYEQLLYPEALAVPLTLGCLLLFLDRRPTPWRAAAAGGLIGVSLLIRPTGFFLLAGVAVSWLLAVGLRRGLAFSALSVVVAVLVVAPWTIRNAVVMHGFVPISLQDAAPYGTFNPDAANDHLYPWAWRPLPPSYAYLYDQSHPVSDVTFRARLLKAARHYVREHPSSVFKAFFWNGLSRLWDVRRPSRALAEVPAEGRSRTVTKIGLWMYYALLPLALIGLWRARRRVTFVAPLGAIVLGACVVFTIAAGTRYRATFEPLIALLACSTVAWLPTLRRHA